MDNLYTRSYPSLYRGIVESNIDPDNMGRCKVRVPSVHGELIYPPDALPWARPIVFSPVSIRRGSANIPRIGDIVWVLFEGAVKDFPVYFGGTYGKGELDLELDKIDFYIEGEDKITYDVSNRTYDIKIGEKHIVVSPTETTIIGDLHVTGTIFADIDVLGNNVSLHEHTHGGVLPGGYNTDKPNQER